MWEAAGCPPPVETTGAPVRPSAPEGICAHCADPGAVFTIDQAISDKFTTVRNAAILWPHGGQRLCAACVWTFKSLSVRTCGAFARRADEHGPGGIWPVSLRPPARPSDWPKAKPWPYTKPDALTALLSPPPAPFVAWLPLYGVDHGGEANASRTFCPDGHGGVFRPADPLWKLQTKHTLPFARISRDARRYDLAVDDRNITVDVELWRRLRGDTEHLLRLARESGIGPTDAREALRKLVIPPGCPPSFVPTWRLRTAFFHPFMGALWWGLFVDLLIVR